MVALLGRVLCWISLFLGVHAFANQADAHTHAGRVLLRHEPILIPATSEIPSGRRPAPAAPGAAAAARTESHSSPAASRWWRSTHDSEWWPAPHAILAQLTATDDATAVPVDSPALFLLHFDPSIWATQSRAAEASSAGPRALFDAAIADAVAANAAKQAPSLPPSPDASSIVPVRYIPHHTMLVRCPPTVAEWFLASGAARWVGAWPNHVKYDDRTRHWLDRTGQSEWLHASRTSSRFRCPLPVGWDCLHVPVVHLAWTCFGFNGLLLS